MMPYIPQKQDNFGKAAALGKLIASAYSMGAGGAAVATNHYHMKFRFTQAARRQIDSVHRQVHAKTGQILLSP